MADYTNESPDQSMTVTDSGGGITSMVSTTLGPQSTTSDWFDPSPNIVTLTRGGTLVPISNQISNLTQTEIDNTNNVPYFDLGETSNLILKSLENGLTYQHGNSTVTIGPAELDLNGANGPIFDLGKESTLQQDSLLSIPRENNNFSYADLDGKDGGNGYFNDTPSPGKGRGKQIDQKDLHVHLLEKNYAYTYGNTTENVGPSPGATGNSEYQDLNGRDQGQGYFHGMNNPQRYQGKAIDKKDLHVHLLENHYVYNHGNSAEFILAGRTQDQEGSQLDLNGDDGGQGYFHGINNPQAYQGKKIKNTDLHRHLLKKSYTYMHGLGTSTTILSENERGHEGGKLDLDGLDEGQGYFHGMKDPQRYQGKQIGKRDLHVHLLDSSFTYTSPRGVSNLVGPSPGPTGRSDFQDFITKTNKDYPPANKALGQFGGPYLNMIKTLRENSEL
tara:strand:- start:564 stop:1895 length:1332 start_codon:yes stop_codon:yes gene_type:complete